MTNRISTTELFEVEEPYEEASNEQSDSMPMPCAGHVFKNRGHKLTSY